MFFESRFEKVLALSDALANNRQSMMECAVRDLNFTVKDSANEIDIAVDRLKMYEQATFLRSRVPLGGPGSRVALMLSYNGSAWLNTTITSLYIVGNQVTVKFSSKANRVRGLTESLYRPIFGDGVSFYHGKGRQFLEDALKD